MARNLYALLVGINEYDPSSRVPPLSGCVNDVQAMAAYLQGRVESDGFQLHLKTLVNEAATRDAVIDQFRTHLCQAEKDDVALFYYAGHGAQADAPEVFWLMDPDHLLETLVCYDSRTEGSWDIADKELAKLIAEVDQKKPHISLILDCCHSGSGTREGGEPTVATRRAKVDQRQRPLDTFLTDSVAEAQTFSSTRSLDQAPVALNLPQGRHVVLSACRDIEEAKEYHSAGAPRGVFSYFLLESLQKANGSLTYRDLFKRTNALVQSRVSAQAPQMDATVPQDLEQPFLGGAIAPSLPYFTLRHDREQGWVIDGGAIHGLTAPTPGEVTRLALYPFDSPPATLKQLQQAVATVEITEVLPQLSKISFIQGEALAEDPQQTWKAVVSQLPLPALSVTLDTEELTAEELAAVRQAIATAGPNGQASLYIRAAEANGDFRLVSRGGSYWISQGTDAKATAAAQGSASLAYRATSPREAIEKLEHMARWATVVALDSPANSRIQGAVEMQFFTGEGAKETAAEIKDAQIRLAYGYDPETQKWQQPKFRIKFKNTSSEVLFCALFNLTERYKVQSLLPGGVVRLEPGQEAWLADGKAAKGKVPDDLWQQGVTEYRDILKLIACTADFDPSLMNQGELGTPLPLPTRSASQGRGSLNRLMKRTITRDISFDAEEEELADDWIANQITFTFVRPQDATPIRVNESIDLGVGVSLKPHAALSANARLTTVPQSTRAVASHVLPPLLVEETEPFQFTATRGSDPGLSALELNQVEDPAAVTAEQPLVVEAEIPLGEDEYILPIAYDGEFYLPLGYGKAKAGKTEIVIERLTAPVADGAVSSRSIQGSIRIFFQKILSKKLGKTLSKKLGVTYDYPILAIAELQPNPPDPENPEVIYIPDQEALKTRIAEPETQTIALYIHGIFGDTESMVPSIQKAQIELGGKTQPMCQAYDLVLAFDYENINTTIDRNARALKQRLNDVGLGVNHGKTLHIIAHSMGGLVSRWFIEQEDGNEVVQHLIMLGTPNGGSPWPEVQAGITTAVSFAINGLSLGFPPLKILGSLLQRIETVDVSLDQMQPGSDFLAEIAAASDPGVPYSIVVGNTSLIEDDPTADLKARLIRKLGKLAELPFFDQPNDIAVAVESIEAVPVGRSPAPRIIPAACNHLVYFKDPAGLAALGDAITGSGITNSNITNSGITASNPAGENSHRANPASSREAAPAPSGTTTASLGDDEEPEGAAITPAPAGGIAGGKGRLWLMVAVGVALAGGLGWAAMRRSPGPEPQPAKTSLWRSEH